MKKYIRFLVSLVAVLGLLVPSLSLAASHFVDPAFTVDEFNAGLYALAVDQNNKLVIGGNFTAYGVDDSNYIVRLNTDGTLDGTFDIGSGFDGPVRSLVIEPDGQIVAAGEFSTYDGISTPGIVRLNADGSRDATLVVGAGFADPTSVGVVAVDENEKILVGGYFSTYDGDSVPNLVRLNSNGTLDGTFDSGTGAGGGINAITFDTDGNILVGGDFTSYDGTPAAHAVRINTDGTIDNTFDIGTGFDFSARAVAVDANGKILLAGGFTEYDGTSEGHIVRLNADGSNDASFLSGTGFDLDVNSIALDGDGKIVAVGNFTQYDGVSIQTIARLNTDGTLDGTFDGGTGFSAAPDSVALDSEGRIIARGNFGTFNGASSIYLARLVADVEAPTVDTFAPLDGATGVAVFNDGGEFSLGFSEDVISGTGNVTLHKASDDSTVETFDVTDGGVTQVTGSTVVFTSGVTLEYDTDYYFLIDGGAFEDGAGNLFAGIADETTWNFTTRTAPPALAFEFERLSVSSEGVEGEAGSEKPAVSDDGRFVAFVSDSSNLVTDDTNFSTDVFVYDRDTDTIERVSVGEGGIEADSYSDDPDISADGRYVAFYSGATNFVDGDTNGVEDIFVYDRDTDTIERVSVSSEAEESDGMSQASSISADGRYVSFYSESTNLVAGDTNGVGDIFVYDRETDTIERVSVSSEAEESDVDSSFSSLSSDGRYVAFDSDATNLVAGDTNGVGDIFVYDRETDTIERVSVSSEGVETDGRSQAPSISANGRYVAFDSDATNLVADDINDSTDVFVYDRETDTVERMGDNAEYSHGVDISGDGRYVVFSQTLDGNQGNTEGVYRYDRDEDELLFITQGALVEGEELSFSRGPSVSEDGLVIGFSSNADNLIIDDTNGNYDIFVYAESTEVDEETPPVDEDSGSNSSHRRGGGGGSSLQGSAATLEQLQLKLIELLTQLLKELMRTQNQSL